MKRRAAGFTLIELLVAATIVGVLASVALPLAELNVKRTRENELRVALRVIRGGLDAYKQAVDDGSILKKADESGWPPNLEVLVAGIEDARSAKKQRIYFLRRLPRDPYHPDPQVPAAATWGLRSHDSPPDEPRAGRDVFDVYTLSTATAIDGTSLRSW